MTMGWQVLAEFGVVQHEKDVAILKRLHEFFGFGQITTNHGDRKELRVRGIERLSEIVRFFRAHPLRTVKRWRFDGFAEFIERMHQGDDLTAEGLAKSRKWARSRDGGDQNPQ